ncbi:MAG: Gfo/Idh/MocA family oxidoreductase [Halioglobus sp.]
MIKWGILGTSFISQVMADAIIAEGQSTLHSVAGRSSGPLQDFARKNNIKNVFSDFDALIEDPGVDVVYIALPNHIHHQYVCKAANAGKAIVCEKSLSVDMGKTDLALTSVAENGVFFLEGLMYLCHPLARTVADLIQSGRIGDVKSIHGDYCAAISEFVNPLSMGVLYNLGCYPVSLMHLVMQSAYGDDVFNNVSVQASGRRGGDGNVCETSAVFRFGSNVQANIHTAEDYGLYSSFSVLGSAGSLELLTNPWLPEATGGQIRITAYEGESELIKVPAAGDGFYYQVKLVREKLEQGAVNVQRPAARPSDSRAIMALLSAWAAVLPN